jgi:hypothetical protein
MSTTYTVTARSTYGHTLGGTFPTIASASRAFTDWTDECVGRTQGLGASEIARMNLKASDRTPLYLAYNGRVFTDRTLARIVYDPFAKEEP